MRLGYAVLIFLIIITMQINDKYKESLSCAKTPATINDEGFKKLLENSFAVLSGYSEIHSMKSILGSKPDLIKELYAALLYFSAQCVRHNQSKEDITHFLTNILQFSSQRANMFIDLYERNKQQIEISLLNIGSHLPHITDVNWKIDYIVKTNILDQSGGPLFRICLSTEKYDVASNAPKIENITFSCNSQELQDLVYKLKDAVRHCQRITTEH